MGLVEQQIKDQLAHFSGQFGPMAIVAAVVTRINTDDTIAVSFSDGSVIEDVRLKAVVKAGNKFLMIPAVGSNVLVGRIRDSEEFVIISTDEITEIKSVIDTVTHSVDNTGLLMQKGTDTLKDALILFVEAMEPIVIIEGRNPDLVKLSEAKIKLQNLLR